MSWLRLGRLRRWRRGIGARLFAVEAWAVGAMIAVESLLLLDWLPLVGLQSDQWSSAQRWLLVLGTGFGVHVWRAHSRLGQQESEVAKARARELLGLHLDRGKALHFKEVESQEELDAWVAREGAWVNRALSFVRDFYGLAESSRLLPSKLSIAQAMDTMKFARSADPIRHRYEHGSMLVNLMCINIQDLMRRDPPFYH